MKRIASFTVNHNTLNPGVYISRIDGDITTYDMRFVKPNTPPFLPNPVMHTIEHLFATYARNSEYADNVIYFGPMGCRTGFYVIFAGDLAWKDIVGVIGEMIDFIINFPDKECDIPGYSPRDCGNYLDNNVMEAKTYARKFKAEVLDNLCPERLTYPE